MAALERVFEVAERNDWVHGVVLNPREDFSVLTRFRVPREGSFRVENTPIDFDSSPFQEFYDACGQFERAVASALKIDLRALSDNYVTAVQQ